MFKLKTQSLEIKNKLNIVDSSNYEYVITDEQKEFEEGKINILVNEDLLDKTNEMLDAIAEGEKIYLLVFSARGQKQVLVNQIQYIESLGDEIFVQMNENRFFVKTRLYQIEDLVMKKDFIRVSKSHIVNIRKIDFIKPAINSKIELIMRNGDKVDVKRTYIKQFKKILEL